MHLALDLAVTLAAFVGHFAIAVWLFNRLHAVAIPRPAIKVLEKLLVLVAALVCLAFAVRWLWTGVGLVAPPRSAASPPDQLVWLSYAVVCWTAALVSLPAWLVPKLLERAPRALESNHTTVVDVAQRLGFQPVAGAETKFFARFAANELLRLHVQRKTLRIANLPPQLAGFTIAHLTDLHMTGRLTREFYDVVVDETNALAPDLIVVTGDILEKENCLPWIGPTLGRLQARHGKYFILGNHEQRLADVQPLRDELAAAGLTDLGSRCEVASLRGVDVLLAGSELPWFGAAPDVEGSGFGVQDSANELPPDLNPEPRTLTPPTRALTTAFRILLSHSPDQLPWARRRKFDLMLAGHNHGGQIRLPYLGALITPSHFGWRYAGGLYHEPPTLLHVSRGIAAVHPLRLNCPPELALLELLPAEHGTPRR